MVTSGQEHRSLFIKTIQFQSCLRSETTKLFLLTTMRILTENHNTSALQNKNSCANYKMSIKGIMNYNVQWKK